MIFFKPVNRVRDEERDYLGLAVVENSCAPRAMFALESVGILIAVCAVKFIKSAFVLGEVRRYPVENYADVVLMENINHLHEIPGRTKTRCGSKISDYLITPRAVKGIFRKRHKLNVGITQFVEVRCHFLGKFYVAEGRAVLILSPRCEVSLVNVHRALIDILLCLFLKPLAVGPFVVTFNVHIFCGGTRSCFHMEAVRVRLHYHSAVLSLNAVFICAEFGEIFNKNLPYSVSDLFHRRFISVPVVIVAYERNRLCVRRPYPENYSCFSVLFGRMRAEEIKSFIVLALMKQVKRNFIIRMVNFYHIM